MQLVIEYTTGSYDSCYTHHYCVEYESKDHFGVAFIDAFQVWAEKQRKHREMNKMLDKVRRSKDLVNTPEWKLWCEYRASSDYLNSQSLIIDGKDFAMIDTYLYDNKLDKHEITDMPEIYTLEEWFEDNRPGDARVRT